VVALCKSSSRGLRDCPLEESGDRTERSRHVRVVAGDVRLFFEVFGQEWPLADVAQVVVPDQRGHGRSDEGSPGTWKLATWAADVKNLSDVLGVEHPVVLGVSFGGFVAQQYAAAYPEHPAGLILLSTGPRFAALDELVARFREVGGEEAADMVRANLAKADVEAAMLHVATAKPAEPSARKPELRES
jgi:pimeloyl-ACP methyl ester carboxylesterase